MMKSDEGDFGVTIGLSCLMGLNCLIRSRRFHSFVAKGIKGCLLQFKRFELFEHSNH